MIIYTYKNAKLFKLISMQNYNTVMDCIDNAIIINCFLKYEVVAYSILDALFILFSRC